SRDRWPATHGQDRPDHAGGAGCDPRRRSPGRTEQGAVGAAAAGDAPAHAGTSRVKPVRLLPVVILSAAALLLFKGLGLVTSGGYVLTGTTVVAAAGEEDDSVAMVPQEPVAADPSPTLQDTAPTVPLPRRDGEGG